MTPQQEARLLRARAATLRAEATLFETIVVAELNGALIQTRIVEAVELEAVAAELEAQVEKEARSLGDSHACSICGHAKRDHATLGITGTQNCHVQIAAWNGDPQQCKCAVFIPAKATP